MTFNYNYFCVNLYCVSALGLCQVLRMYRAYILNTKLATYRCHICTIMLSGEGPRVVVSTAAFHARVRGLVPGLGGLKETQNVSSPSTCESQYCGEPP